MATMEDTCNAKSTTSVAVAGCYEGLVQFMV